jgi:hypothetical protein
MFLIIAFAVPPFGLLPQNVTQAWYTPYPSPAHPTNMLMPLQPPFYAAIHGMPYQMSFGPVPQPVLQIPASAPAPDSEAMMHTIADLRRQLAEMQATVAQKSVPSTQPPDRATHVLPPSNELPIDVFLGLLSGEGLYVEYKASSLRLPPIAPTPDGLLKLNPIATKALKTVVSMWNTPRVSPGYIVFGVREDDNKMLWLDGVDAPLPDDALFRNLFQHSQFTFVPRFDLVETSAFFPGDQHISSPAMRVRTRKATRFHVLKVPVLDAEERRRGLLIPKFNICTDAGEKVMQANGIYARKGSSNVMLLADEAKDWAKQFTSGLPDFDISMVMNHLDLTASPHRRKLVIISSRMSKVSAARLSKLAGSSVCVVFDFDPRSKIDGLFKEWNPLPSTEVVTTENKDWAYGVSKDTELVWLFCLGLHDIQTSYQRTSTSGAAVPPRSLDCNRPSTP